jgi:hypothetical protein
MLLLYSICSFSYNSSPLDLNILISIFTSDVLNLENIPGGKVSILGGHSIGHSNKKLYMYMCPILNDFRD